MQEKFENNLLKILIETKSYKLGLKQKIIKSKIY